LFGKSKSSEGGTWRSVVGSDYQSGDLVFAHNQMSIEHIDFFETRVSKSKVRHLGCVGVGRSIDDLEFNERAEEPAQL